MGAGELKRVGRGSWESFRMELLFALFVGLCASAHGGIIVDGHDGQRSYAGYKLIRTALLDKDLSKELMILDAMNGVHFWTWPQANATADILASPDMEEAVRSLLTRLSVDHDIVIHDVDEVLREENPRAIASQIDPKSLRMNWDAYHRYDVIKSFAESLGSSRNGLVSTDIIGRSTEGRDIIMMKIAKRDGRSRPAIFVDGGMHAREWISPATTTYIMNKLATESNGRSGELLEAFDWYFVPVINVDGYEYTHERDRFWRKTRSRTGSLWCRGVDPNRNWDFHWSETGSSRDPCSDIYAGPRAFSEPETRAVANAILARKNIVMYLTFHSYSQLWLVPYGYGDQKPADYNELYTMALQGKKALEGTYGTRYKIGTAPDLLYKAAGGSDDWAKGAAGIKYSYTLELRDTGRYGFALPANQIKATGEETYNGVMALARAIATKLNKNKINIKSALLTNLTD